MRCGAAKGRANSSIASLDPVRRIAFWEAVLATAPATFRSGLTIDRNNNPGALRVPGSTQFQRFASQAQGIAAQETLLSRYIRRGLNSVQTIVETYAPRQSRGGDNTDAQVNNYIAHVARRLGVNPGTPLGPADVRRLAAAMREFETGRKTF
jgi:hypothetical protein